MCLGIPGKIISIEEDQVAEIDFGGVNKKVSLALCPDARVGDYVLVHVGFAIQKMDEKDALETREVLKLVLGPDEKAG
ncbi:MAG: HypC/HybG/HupF family hydrogenase formation chaperone [bacterium]|nr:HypC/HybG/HupF family hydrogenase formation chaperone [bacterium]